MFETGKSHRPRSCLATGDCAPIFLLIFLSAFYLAPKFFCEQENRHISQAAISLFRAAFQKGGEGERMEIIAFLRGCCSRISPLFISFSHSSFKREISLFSSCAAEPDLAVLAPPVIFLLLVDADEAGTGTAGPEGLAAVNF